jgi:hypothetical protein
MLIKTREFDNKFNQEVKWITPDQKRSLWQKGSYKIKEWGEIVTDIDLQANVRFDSSLIDILSRMLYNLRVKHSPFIFIRMAVGRYKGYKLPWVINDKGSCDFNLNKAKAWFVWFKDHKMVPDRVLEYIREKLSAPELRISDLIDIENAIQPYAEINWLEDDIRRGFIQRSNTKYILLDEMKTETPVLEFAYQYGPMGYIGIDVGLVDKKYAVAPTDGMYRYYKQDWYKVMKGFRWKIPETEKADYFTRMNTINRLIALKYQMEFIQKLIKYHTLPKDITDKLEFVIHTELSYIRIYGHDVDDLLKNITDDINIQLESFVTHFADMLADPEDRKEALMYLQRGKASLMPVSQDILVQRYKAGNNCPFFSTDMTELELLVNLALRIEMDPDQVVDCFTQISKNVEKPIRDVYNEVIAQNNFLIHTSGDQVILYDGNEELKRLPLSRKQALQIFIITGVVQN